MAAYRYRTAALAGPWRSSRALAARDAVQARQAEESSDAPDGLQWRVPGEIEERATERA